MTGFRLTLTKLILTGFLVSVLGPDEARVLGPLVYRALGSGRRVTGQLEAMGRENGFGDG